MNPNHQIFVTGATGFIGSRLVQKLVESGHRVRALTRRATPDPIPGFDEQRCRPLAHHQVELVRGDVTEPESLLDGMQGCQLVFHLAAYAKNWSADASAFERINVDGTRNVLAAAKKANVQRVVCTSTIVTFGPTPSGTIGDETLSRTTGFFTEYERTKALAQQVALESAAEGFPVIIVNPTRVFGPGHLTEANSLTKLIDRYDRGKFPLLLNRGVNVGNYVLVDDVVAGHVLAMERGRIGKRYILGGENVTLKELFRTVDRVSGRRHWQIPVRASVALLFARWQQKRAEWFGLYPKITPGWVKTFSVDWAFSSDKAIHEIGYRPTPLEQGIRQTYRWLSYSRRP